MTRPAASPQSRTRTRPTPEERSAGLVNPAGFVAAVRWSSAWCWLTIGAALWSGVNLAGAEYLLAAQITAQTGFVRPLSPERRAWLEDSARRGLPVRAADLATWRPQGWAGQYIRRWESCQQNERCHNAYSTYRRYLQATPELQARYRSAQQGSGALLLSAVCALVSATDVRLWAYREREAITRNDPRKRRKS